MKKEKTRWQVTEGPRRRTTWASQKTDDVSESSSATGFTRYDLKIGSVDPDTKWHMHKRKGYEKIQVFFFFSPTRSRRDIPENSKAPTFPH